MQALRRVLLWTVILMSFIDLKAQAYAKQYLLKGKIVDSRGKKGISRIPFFVKPFNKKVEANKQGEFLFKLRKGKYAFIIDFYPFNKKEVKIDLCSDTTLLIELSSDIESIYIQEVEVLSTKPFTKLPSGIEQISKKTLNTLPALIGERDILKALSQTSGVSSSSEGSADMQVRGGTHGQNLYLLDGIPLYSTEHFFGMVSAYNPIIIKSARLYKSSFPTEYGGKVSSVIDVLTEDAKTDKPSASFDISLLSSKLQLSAPIVKNKLSISLAGRISNYSLLNISSLVSPDTDDAKFNLYFGDINANLFWKLSDNDKLKITWFNNSDGFDITTKEISYIEDYWIDNKQQNIGINWYRSFSPKTENHFLAYIDSYAFDYGTANTSLEEAVKNIHQMVTGINSIGVSEKITSSFSDTLRLTSGASFKNIGFTPFKENINDSTTRRINIGNLIRLSEFVVFSETNWQFLPNHQLTTGLRLSIIGNSSCFFPNVEPRINYHGIFKNHFSTSASVGRLTQPIHRLANSGLGFPIEIFMPSGNKLAPQTSWNFSVGAAKDFTSLKNTISLKADIWYKTFQNITEFKDGIDALSIILYGFDIANYPEDYITQGKGKSYGIDLNTSITKRKWSLSLDYTLMQAINQFEDLNFGKPFAASTDIRHLFNLTFKRNISSHLTLVMSWQYRSGKPITIPTRIFQYPDLSLETGELSNSYRRFMMIEDERNNYRTKPFHKLDIALTKEYIAFKRYDASFSLGIYNVYNRANPYIYYLSQKWGSGGAYQPVLKSMQMFPIMPSFSWTMKF